MAVASARFPPALSPASATRLGSPFTFEAFADVLARDTGDEFGRIRALALLFQNHVDCIRYGRIFTCSRRVEFFDRLRIQAGVRVENRQTYRRRLAACP
jgi:hypothetical protein